jgi:hypothetical protein
MIGLMDLTESEQQLLVNIAEGVLLHGGIGLCPHWLDTRIFLSETELRDYFLLSEKELIHPLLPGSCQQVMPTRDAVQLIRWLQGLD